MAKIIGGNHGCPALAAKTLHAGKSAGHIALQRRRRYQTWEWPHFRAADGL
jgi:hypothetical protein